MQLSWVQKLALVYWRGSAKAKVAAYAWPRILVTGPYQYTTSSFKMHHSDWPIRNNSNSIRHIWLFHKYAFILLIIPWHWLFVSSPHGCRVGYIEIMWMARRVVGWMVSTATHNLFVRIHLWRLLLLGVRNCWSHKALGVYALNNASRYPRFKSFTRRFDFPQAITSV